MRTIRAIRESRWPRKGALAFYVDTAAGVGREKRRSPRYPSTHGLCLRWRDGDTQHVQAGELLDISLHGALVVVPDRHRVGQRVVISLDEDPAAPRVKAVVWSVEPGQSSRLVRLVFRRPCPEAVLDAAVKGISLPHRPAEGRPCDGSARGRPRSAESSAR